MACNSFSVYKNAVKNFSEFRTQYRLQEVWPAPVTQIILFISCCFEKAYSASTISTYISGIGFFHKINNWCDPTQLFVVRKLLEGCRRSRPSSDNRAPITFSVLTRVVGALHSVCFSNYEVKLFTAAYLLTYYGMLRVSEVVFTTQAQANRPLLITDMVIEPHGKALQIRIRFSKTNQTGRPTGLRIPVNGSKATCCVNAMQQFLAVRPQYEGFLFCHIDKTPLKRSQFAGVLSKTIRSLGLPVGVFKTHSFRIGRATSLASQGVSSETIQTMGRWRSNVYKKYIRMEV